MMNAISEYNKNGIYSALTLLTSLSSSCPSYRITMRTQCRVLTATCLVAGWSFSLTSVFSKTVMP